MIERIKLFEQKNKNSQQTNSRNSIEKPNKKIINTEVHKSKYVDDSETSNSYVNQTIKKKSFIKMNNNENNTSLLQILKSKINDTIKNTNRSAEKGNLIYKNFVKNLKMNINGKEYNEIDKNYTNRKRIKNKKSVFGDFLNKFINKSQIQTEKISNNTQILIINNNDTNVNKLHYFKNLNKINNINIYLESSKKHEISIDNNNNNNQDNNELILLKKELQLKENTIKELYKSLQRQNYIIQENEKLKEEIANLKSILNRGNNSNNNNNAIKDNNINDNVIKSGNCKINNYNNLITYNINKNNNYNIINSKIDNLDNLNNINNLNKNNINNINTIKIEKDVPPSINTQVDRKNVIENEKTKKANRAFQRFKKNRSIDITTKESKERQNNLLKSDKISMFAKMLEGRIGSGARERSMDVCEKNRNGIIIEDDNNEILDIINNQPVINKKKKKLRRFSIDG